MKKHKGYSLLELMVILVVAGIVLAVGVPQMKVFFQGNQMVANTNDLVTAMHLARSEAIKQAVPATVCKSSTADSATPACDTSAGWEDGWLVFTEDSTGAARGTVGVYEPTNGDQLLRVHVAAEGENVTITAQDGSIADYVSFSSRGLPRQADGTTQSGVLSICDIRGLKNASGNVIARGIEITASGRAGSTNDADKIVSCP